MLQNVSDVGLAKYPANGGMNYPAKRRLKKATGLILQHYHIPHIHISGLIWTITQALTLLNGGS